MSGYSVPLSSRKLPTFLIKDECLQFFFHCNLIHLSELHTSIFRKRYPDLLNTILMTSNVLIVTDPQTPEQNHLGYVNN